SAVRAVAPGLPIGVSTGAWIEPDAAKLLELVRAWEVLPDFASVNFHEDGTVALATLLLERGVGVEAGLWTREAAELFASSEVASQCFRILLEPRATEDAEALRTAHEISVVLDAAQVATPRLLHGTRGSTWGVLRAALDLGCDVRVGLEDTT